MSLPFRLLLLQHFTWTLPNWKRVGTFLLRLNAAKVEAALLILPQSSFKSSNCIWHSNTNKQKGWRVGYLFLHLIITLTQKRDSVPCSSAIEVWYLLLFIDVASGSSSHYSSKTVSISWPSAVPKAAPSHKDESVKINPVLKWKQCTATEITFHLVNPHLRGIKQKNTWKLILL